jgi:penicillin amidase
MIKKAIVFAAVILLVLLLIVWVGLPRLFSLSVADYDGVEHLEAITHPVEISFDKKGIPQVWAESEPDLYFSLGWLHAAERLFQMELARRISQGTMAELLGEDMHQIHSPWPRNGPFPDRLYTLPIRIYI